MQLISAGILPRLLGIKKYAELVAFKETHGHCNVPWGIAGSSLGEWCGRQRKHYRQGTLSPKRFAQLDALGFRWQFRIPNRTEIEHAFPPVDLVNPAEGLNARTESQQVRTSG
jgi:hypothetical protein